MKFKNKLSSKNLLIVVMCTIGLLYAATFVAPLFVPYTATQQSSLLKYANPSSSHMLGCDYLGRDVFVRVCMGIRLSMEISFIAVLIGALIGTAYGVIAAYHGGRLENIMCAILDILQSIPDFLIAMLLMFIITTTSDSNSVLGILLTIAMLYWIPVARIVRTATKDILSEDYITYSKLSGGGFLHNATFNIIPNIRNTIITTAVLRIPAAIFLESFLSFIGVGVKPPDPSLGKMISEGVQALRIAPHLMIAPVVFLVFIILLFNLTGDLFIRTIKDSIVLSEYTPEITPAKLHNNFNRRNKEILRIEHLNVCYSINGYKKPILTDISFYAQCGEFISIIGETGCGKSTLVKAITGLLDNKFNIDFSTAFIAGVSIQSPKKLKKHIKRLYGNSIGMVFQDSIGSLNPTMTIGKHFKILYRQLVKPNLGFSDMFSKALNAVDLSEPLSLLNKYPSEISGGMAQKVSIALALFKTPTILFLDEPTSSLDVYSQNEVLALIKKFHASHNITICMITHDLNLARDISNRIVVLQNGRIVDYIVPLEHEVNSTNLYTKELISNARDAMLGSTIVQNSQIDDDNNIIVSVKNISKIFHQRTVLKNLSFDILRTESLGLIGRSGVGKSTICKILLGLYAPDSGEVKIADDLNIEMVFQNASHALNPSKKIINILKERERISNISIPDHDIQSLINLCRLQKDVLYRRPSMLSGGQQQKVALVRALLTNPDFLIFDEPTTALDVVSQKELLELLLEIKKTKSLTYLFVSHNPYVINKMCNRVISLDNAVNI